jgi:hypothetical protein
VEVLFREAPSPGEGTERLKLISTRAAAGSTLTLATSLNELNEIVVKPITIPIVNTVGEHCILELYACD